MTESPRMRPWPCSEPMVGVPRKITNALAARAKVDGAPANCAAMTPTMMAAATPLPTLAIMANRTAAFFSVSERARARAWASTHGMDTVATAAAHMSTPWPAANFVKAPTGSSRVISSVYP